MFSKTYVVFCTLESSLLVSLNYNNMIYLNMIRTFSSVYL